MMMSKQTLLLTLTVVMSYSPVRTAPAWSMDWDYFTFTQSWPPGTCSAGVHEKHTCHVGSNVTTWTIHGLWPDKHHGIPPYNCSPSLKFDIHKIKSLTKQLNTFWPNLYSDTPHDSFWAHEWEKHGTCAASLPATKNEFLFFEKGLVLNSNYSLGRILANAQVTPSDTKQYHFNDFSDAIKNYTGHEPILECTGQKQHDGTYRSIIYQIEICFNKSFVPISCDQTRQPERSNYPNLGSKDNTLYYAPRKSQQGCSPTKAFYYPPIKHV